MLQFQPISFQSKDGREAMLRLPQKEDAEALLTVFKTMLGETDFLSMAPEDANMTVHQEEAFIESAIQNENLLMLLCIVDGRIAGDCELRRRSGLRMQHRGEVGISILREYWGQGIGTACFQAMIAQARAWQLRQMELTFTEGNSRARRLYERMGFRITGMRPDAIRLQDGRLLNEYQMTKMMEERK